MTNLKNKYISITVRIIMFVQKNKTLFLLMLVLADLALVNFGYILAFFIKFGWSIPEVNFTAYLKTWP